MWFYSTTYLLAVKAKLKAVSYCFARTYSVQTCLSVVSPPEVIQNSELKDIFEVFDSVLKKFFNFTENQFTVFLNNFWKWIYLRLLSHNTNPAFT